MSKSITISPDIGSERVTDIHRLFKLKRGWVCVTFTPTDYYSNTDLPLSVRIKLTPDVPLEFEHSVAYNVLCASTKDGLQFIIVEGITGIIMVPG